ncbi:hypothetical protein HDV00_006677 [Rhizophlyctis rosea]|nr:hypothetical protein HDV00_006677 [Rhizophlyctis rosea]
MYDRERDRTPGSDRDAREDRERDDRQADRDRDRSRSPEQKRRRSRSPDRDRGRDDRDDGSVNPGTNLFVTGLSHRTRDEDLEAVFGKFGKISKCAIMYDPHSRESRGFAFVSFEDLDAADAAMENINRKYELHGRILTVARAKRARARTPTPGQYYGPPKREGDGRRREGRDTRDRGYDRDRYDRGDRYDRDRGYGRDRYDRERDRRRRSPY